MIRAAGAWSMRVMLPWTSACSTVATSSSGTLATVPTGSWLSSSTEVATSGSTCTTRSIGCPGSRVTWVTVWATSALRTSFATWAAVSPTAKALVGSTVIWISAVAWTRSLWRLARVGSSSSAARTASVVVATCSRSSALTMIVSPLEVKPAASETWTS